MALRATAGTGGGGVSSITFGSGLTGGTISTSGTVTVDPTQSVAYSVAQTYSIALAANTSGDGLTLIDPTAAAAAAQQFSPRLRLSGKGWATTPVASQPVDWIVENQPTQGAATAGTNLVLSSQVNGGGYVTQLTISQNSVANFAGSIACTTLTVSSGVVPVVGIYRPVANVLGFSSANTGRGSIDATGNWIYLFPTADQSKSVQVPTTGFTITFANTSKTLILNPAGTLASGTITMPPGPIDGQEVRLSSSQTVTALTVSPNTSQTISNAPTTIAPGQGYAWIYHLAGTNWYRLY